MISEHKIKKIIKENVRKFLLEMSPRPLTPLEVFINRANAIHNNKYDYSKVNYTGTDDNVCIICPEHGEFWQTPHHHLQGQKCRACNREFKLETRTAYELKKHNIEFLKDKTPFEWLGRLQLDFYLPSLNIAIECQGIQHFQPRERYGGQNGYDVQIERDKRKAELCKSHNVPLYFITYKEWNNIPTLIDEILKNHMTC